MFGNRVSEINFRTRGVIIETKFKFSLLCEPFGHGLWAFLGVEETIVGYM